MARPRKPETLKPLIVRLSDATKQKLTNESKKAGTSLAETIRKKLE